MQGMRRYVLEACDEREWRTGRNLRDRVAQARADAGDWGMVSFAIALISKRAAQTFLKYRLWELYVTLNHLCEEELLEAQQCQASSHGPSRLMYRRTNTGTKRLTGPPSLSADTLSAISVLRQ
jgi:hypothetical protein